MHSPSGEFLNIYQTNPLTNLASFTPIFSSSGDNCSPSPHYFHPASTSFCIQSSFDGHYVKLFFSSGEYCYSLIILNLTNTGYIHFIIWREPLYSSILNPTNTRYIHSVYWTSTSLWIWWTLWRDSINSSAIKWRYNYLLHFRFIHSPDTISNVDVFLSGYKHSLFSVNTTLSLSLFHLTYLSPLVPNYRKNVWESRELTQTCFKREVTVVFSQNQGRQLLHHWNYSHDNEWRNKLHQQYQGTELF